MSEYLQGELLQPHRVSFDLMPAALAQEIPPLRAQEYAGANAIVYARYICPLNGWTWYATEFDSDEGEFFGLVQGFEEEYGAFSLAEFETLRGFILRDLEFHPTAIGTIADHGYQCDEQRYNNLPFQIEHE